MNSTPSNRPVHSEPGFRDAGLDEILKDVSRLGPAPTPSRELFATIVTVVILAAGIFILEPEPAVAAAIAGAGVVYTAIRWVLGTRKWSNS